MLRKLPCERSFATFVVRAAPLFRQSRRFFAIRSTSFFLQGKPPITPANTAPNAADEEDRQELERERNLRERFAQKIQQSLPQTQAYGDSGKWASFANTSPPNIVVGGTKASMFNFFFFTLLLLFPLMLFAGHGYQMNDLQRIPWRELPITTVACYLLLCTLYSRREQRRIKSEFQDASRRNAYLTFDQFIAQRYPNFFNGYQASQAEAIAAISACLVAAKDLKFAGTMLRAVGRAKDTRASVDALLVALRKDFPNVF